MRASADAALSGGLAAPLPGYYQLKPGGMDRIDLSRLLPPLLTTFLSVLFLVPVWILMNLGTTEGVSYFISQAFWVSLLVPAAILVTHVAMVWRVAIQKSLVGTMVVGSSALLLWVAESMHRGAIDQSMKLSVTDCSAFPEKRVLQESWEAAYNLYSGCINETAKAKGFSREELMASFRIQDCEEYEAALHAEPKRDGSGAKNFGREWAYLRYLEETEMCSGWCYEGVQLWSKSPHKDSCSTAVSDLFGAVIAPYSWQVSVVMVSALGLYVAQFVVLGPMRMLSGK